MARTRTLLQLRTAVRRRIDGENSTFWSDAELNILLSSAYAWVYEMLVECGLYYFESTQTITSISGTATYAVAADYLHTIGVDWQMDSTTWVGLKHIGVESRNDYPSGSSPSVAYRVVGSNVTLYPTPSAVQTYRHVYIPAATDLSSDSDSIDAVVGWEELVIVAAAIKALRKEESDTSGLERDQALLVERIMSERENRDLMSTGVVRDVERCYLDPADIWSRRPM